MIRSGIHFCLYLFYKYKQKQVVTINEKEELKAVLAQGVNLLYSHYNDMVVSQIFIRYSILASDDPKAKVSLKGIISNTQNVKLTVPNLPNTTNL